MKVGLYVASHAYTKSLFQWINRFETDSSGDYNARTGNEDKERGMGEAGGKGPTETDAIQQYHKKQGA